MLGAMPTDESSDDSDDGSSSEDERPIARSGRDMKGTQSMMAEMPRRITRKVDQAVYGITPFR